jgi:isopenicillin N synthase-like dioxygenase
MSAAFARLFGRAPTAMRKTPGRRPPERWRAEGKRNIREDEMLATCDIEANRERDFFRHRLREANMTAAVPVIDISGFAPGDEPVQARIAKQVSAALEEIGFLVVQGHNVDPKTIAALREQAWRFFDLPLVEKMRWRKPIKGAFRGYVTADDENLTYMQNEDSPSDLKEFFGFGKFDYRDDPYYRQSFAYLAFPPNIWPEQPVDLKSTAMQFYREMETLTEHLLRIFEKGLRLNQGFFRDKFDRHASTVRLLNYPNQVEDPLPGQLRYGAHYDFTAIILLAVDNAPGGLQVQSRAGDWIDIPLIRNGIVLNIGDLMANWTNDRWRSGLHRVVNPPRDLRGSTRRLSLVYFVNPNYDVSIECLPGCQDAGHPTLYAPVKAGEHRVQKILSATSRLRVSDAAR